MVAPGQGLRLELVEVEVDRPLRRVPVRVRHGLQDVAEIRCAGNEHLCRPAFYGMCGVGCLWVL